MIYFYNIKISFLKGDKPFIVDYKVSFCEIGRFFSNLEKKHGDNYSVISIKELTRPFYIKFYPKKED